MRSKNVVRSPDIPSCAYACNNAARCIHTETRMRAATGVHALDGSSLSVRPTFSSIRVALCLALSSFLIFTIYCYRCRALLHGAAGRVGLRFSSIRISVSLFLSVYRLLCTLGRFGLEARTMHTAAIRIEMQLRLFQAVTVAAVPTSDNLGISTDISRYKKVSNLSLHLFVPNTRTSERSLPAIVNGVWLHRCP